MSIPDPVPSLRDRIIAEIVPLYASRWRRVDLLLEGVRPRSPHPNRRSALLTTTTSEGAIRFTHIPASELQTVIDALTHARDRFVSESGERCLVRDVE